jgi:hypothetical protein
MNPFTKSVLAFILASACFCPRGLADSWKDKLTTELPLLGHRNWIVIVDSAYPLQTSPGIETVVTGESQLDVLRTVLATLQKTKHVQPVIYTDEELKSVPEKYAPGIQAYRRDLAQILGDRPVQSLLHEQIIAKLDDAGKTFHILVLKTNLTLPYTSVFLQLQCGYWSSDAETALRKTMSHP